MRDFVTKQDKMNQIPQLSVCISTKTVGTIALESRPNSPTYARLPNFLYTAELCTLIKRNKVLPPYIKLLCCKVALGFYFCLITETMLAKH